MRAVWEIARHELWVLLRSKRAVAVALLYLGSAALGSTAYVVALRKIQDNAKELLVAQGMDPSKTDEAVTLLGEKAYQGVLAFVAGAKPEALAETLKASVVLPVMLWAALVFLPLLILLTSFDQLTGDLGNRSLLFTTLRAPRWSLVVGKMLAHGAAFAVMLGLSSAFLFGLASVFVDGLDFSNELLGLGRLGLSLVPFGLCYVGISAFASTLHRQPFVTLLAAVGLLFGLRALSWFRYIPETSDWAPVAYVSWLSPARYHDGLWLQAWTGPVGSAAVYLAFAVGFAALAILRLETRDL